MSILNKITPGKWESTGINIMAKGKPGRIGQSFLIHIPSYNNKFAECQESIANAKVWAASKEMLSIIEKLAKWLNEENEPNGNAVIHIAEEAETLLTELNK